MAGCSAGQPNLPRHSTTRAVTSAVEGSIIALWSAKGMLQRNFLSLSRSNAPQGHQRENRIHHRRIDRGESFSPLDVIQHPDLRFAQRALAQRLPGQFLVEL